MTICQEIPRYAVVTKVRLGDLMYQVLHNSKITLNRHIDIAEIYANNLRLLEATSVGTMLLTDWGLDLHAMFEPGKEIVAYRSPQECLELINYYLTHDDEREPLERHTSTLLYQLWAATQRGEEVDVG